MHSAVVFLHSRPPPPPPCSGTVIPANDSIFAAVDVGAFLKRTVSPKAGEGAFVVGNLDGRLLGVGASVQLVDGRGTILAST